MTALLASQMETSCHTRMVNVTRAATIAALAAPPLLTLVAFTWMCDAMLLAIVSRAHTLPRLALAIGDSTVHGALAAATWITGIQIAGASRQRRRGKSGRVCCCSACSDCGAVAGWRIAGCADVMALSTCCCIEGCRGHCGGERVDACKEHRMSCSGENSHLYRLEGGGWSSGRPDSPVSQQCACATGDGSGVCSVDDAIAPRRHAVCWLPYHVMSTGVAAALSCGMDVDHFVAARSLRLEDAVNLSARPVLHSVVGAVAAALVIESSAVLFGCMLRRWATGQRCVRREHPRTCDDASADDNITTHNAFSTWPHRRVWFVALIIAAWGTHQLRDATRRGITLWPEGPTSAPLSLLVYLVAIAATALVVAGIAPMSA